MRIRTTPPQPLDFMRPIALLAAFFALPLHAQLPSSLLSQQQLLPKLDNNDDNYGIDVAMCGDWMAVCSRVGGPSGSIGLVDFYSWDGSKWGMVQSFAPPIFFLPGNVDIDGDIAAVGSLGHADFFERSGSTWTQTDSIFLGTDLDWQTMKLSGDTLVATRTGFGGAKTVVVSNRVGGAWSAPSVLTPTGPLPINFGAGVALDGDTMVIAVRADIPGGGIGSNNPAFVFRKGAHGWTQEARIDPPAGTTSLKPFGKGVDVEGDTLALGAAYGDGPGGAFVYTRTGSTWTLQQQIPSPNGFLDAFGEELVLDGERLLVGAPKAITSGQPGLGAAYVYVNEQGTWNLWTHLDAVDKQSDSGSASLGKALAMDGGRAVAGNRLYDLPGFDSGRVLTYTIPSVNGPSLIVDTDEISLSTGGHQDMGLFAGSPRAGQLYLVLGSLSGTAPGIPLDGLELPLVFDSYWVYTLTNPNTLPYQGTLGTLDAAGVAWAKFRIPAGSNPGLAGLTIHHAFAAVDVALPTVTFTSNAEGVTLVP